MRAARLALLAIATSLAVWLAGVSTASAATGYGNGSLGSGGVTASGAVPGNSATPAGDPRQRPLSNTGAGNSYTSPPPNPAPSTTSAYKWELLGGDLLAKCGPGGRITTGTIVGPTGPGSGQSLGPAGATGLANLYDADRSGRHCCSKRRVSEQCSGWRRSNVGCRSGSSPAAASASDTR